MGWGGVGWDVRKRGGVRGWLVEIGVTGRRRGRGGGGGGGGVFSGL